MILVSSGALVGEDEHVVAHWNRMQSTDEALRDDLKALILGLKEDGLWDRLDFLCVPHTLEADSLLDLKGDYDSTNPDGCTFTADQGFTTQSSPKKYIRTGFNVVVGTGRTKASVEYPTMFFYIRSAGTSSSPGPYFMGTRYGMKIDLFNSSGTTRALVHSHTSVAGPAVGSGFWLCTRAPNTFDVIVARNSNRVVESKAWASQDELTEWFVGTINTSTGPGEAVDEQFSCWGGGGGLTSIQVEKLYNRIQGYMTARGTAV